MVVDLNRIATAAVESFLREGEEPARQSKGRSGHLGGIGAVAVGIGIAVAARATYNRARRFDLAQMAEAVENKLSG